MAGLSLFLGILFYSVGALAALPPDAQALLDTFPGKQLSLELVIERALHSSDSYRALTAQMTSVEAPWLLAKAVTDPRLQAKANWVDDRREALGPFNPTSIKTTTYALGVSSLFTTGTTVNAELSHGFTDLGFSQFPGIDTTETKGLLSLSQNLWQDAFGRGTRAGIESARLTSEATRAALQEAKEDWFFQLADLYYASWLAQAQQNAATASVKRRQRLLRTVEIKTRRGTSERPDLLQVQSAIANADVQLAQAKQALADKWRSLVMALKLPEAWMAIDPIEIPLALDDSPERAKASCGPEDALLSAPESSTSVEKGRLQHEAAKLAVEKARNDLSPDLKLSLALGSNGVDPSSGTAASELARWNHPVWMAGVSFTMPLGFRAEEARLQSALADELRSEASKNVSGDTLKVSWKNSCYEIHRLQKSRELLKVAVKLQAEREKLEEERFNIGRSGTLQVIQAGDDATQSELLLDQIEAQIRASAWRVAGMRGEVVKLLTELEKRKAPSR